EHIGKGTTRANNQFEPAANFSFADQYPLRILIAEDNPVNQTLAIHILKMIGYTADIAETGFEVIEALGKTQYHLIFMDIQMPEMDGLLTTSQIRAGSYKQPIIIAMTAN